MRIPTVLLAGLAAALGACDTLPPAPAECVFVELEHLARPRDGGGNTMVCNPRRISPAYVDLYYPGFDWREGNG